MEDQIGLPKIGEQAGLLLNNLIARFFLSFFHKYQITHVATNRGSATIAENTSHTIIRIRDSQGKPFFHQRLDHEK